MTKQKKTALQQYFEAHPDPFMPSENIKNEKKTALDLMAEELVPRIKCGGQGVCPITEELCCDTEEKPCIENVKQYFQEQADIPDGWNVVKEIYKYTLDGSSNIARVSNMAKEQLQQAGIEVE